eukprot:CAMPEP_0194493612 /NCGR_PEP_ID=MMETSP0253-20130528/11771_1 /TAXON_ID=2966 /ORGANISM="Noctiluca scintillans" /LENGTH=40 /DNA_ID= /DNA_START= /DNA_END= /DNA_ORIENTATION=
MAPPLFTSEDRVPSTHEVWATTETPSNNEPTNATSWRIFD